MSITQTNDGFLIYFHKKSDINKNKLEGSYHNTKCVHNNRKRIQEKATNKKSKPNLTKQCIYAAITRWETNFSRCTNEKQQNQAYQRSKTIIKKLYNKRANHHMIKTVGTNRGKHAHANNKKNKSTSDEITQQKKSSIHVNFEL